MNVLFWLDGAQGYDQKFSRFGNGYHQRNSVAELILFFFIIFELFCNRREIGLTKQDLLQRKGPRKPTQYTAGYG